jgi:hypothetical protein
VANYFEIYFTSIQIIWSIALYCFETLTLRKVDQKYLESFELWYWGSMEVTWTNCVRNEEILRKLMEERIILHTIKRRKATWIGHILRTNCLLKHIIEGTIRGIEMKVRQGRRHKQLLDDLKETRGCWELREEALDRTV